MSNPTLKLGDGNWAVKTGNLLGYAVGETSNKFVPRELTFTRASSATRVNSEGLIEKVRTNLALYSEEFDNGVWIKTSTTITANSAVAPNGTTTADKIECSTNLPSTSFIRQALTVGNGSQNTFSIYIKPITDTSLRIDEGAYTGKNITFNLSTGNITTTGGPYSNYSIITLANGWFQCIFSWQFSAGQDFWYFNINNQSAYIWGAQLETGDIATEYIPTTTATVSVGVTANIPRVDYSQGSSPSLLLEPQRTNLALYSEQFDNAAWNKLNTTISANAAASPDGTTSADLVYPTTTGTDRLIEQIIVATTGQTWTSSFFVKASGFSWVLVYSPNLRNCWFNASTGTFGTIAAGVTATVLGQVNGFWRVSFTGTIASGNAYFYAGPADANNSNTATASGTNGLLIWGAQLELGSYPTSYIPTLGTSVTRVADFCNKTGISSLIGSTEGVLYAEVDYKTTNNSGTVLLDVNDNGLTNRVALLFGAGAVGCFVQGSTRISYTVPSFGTYKIAFAYKSGDFVLYVNGVQTGTNSSSITFSGMNQLFLGHTFNIDGTQPVNGINQALLFKTRLSNTELAELTTI